MRTNTASSDIRNHLMLVVAFGTGIAAVNEFAETDKKDVEAEAYVKRTSDLWSRSWVDLHKNLFSYEGDENSTESLSWSSEEILEFWNLYRPNTNTSQRLLRALGELKGNTNEFSEYIGNPISMRSISAAERIASQLPDTLPAGKIGLDEDGDVFLSFHQDDVSVFLTVEPDKLHLLIKSVGEQSRYFDEVPYNDFEIPTKILEELSEI